MKIDNVSHLSTPGRVDHGKSSEKTGDATAKSEAGSGSVTHLSQTDASQDIDHARVAELRQAIADGHLRIDTDRIADSLIANVRDLLDGGQ